MHKLSAVILLLPVATLFVGTMRMGSICAIRPAAPSPVADGCGSGGCHRSQDQPKQKDASPCCPECPLCASVTLSHIFRVEVLRQEKITEYAVLPDNPLSDYPEEHWKPPDTALVS